MCMISLAILKSNVMPQEVHSRKQCSTTRPCKRPMQFRNPTQVLCLVLFDFFCRQLQQKEGGVASATYGSLQKQHETWHTDMNRLKGSINQGNSVPRVSNSLIVTHKFFKGPVLAAYPVRRRGGRLSATGQTMVLAAREAALPWHIRSSGRQKLDKHSLNLTCQSADADTMQYGQGLYV